MNTIYINDSSKHITISDDFYLWLRDISDPCILVWDDEVGAETIDSADYEWWSTQYETHQKFETLYSQASDADKKTADTAIEHEEFNDRAVIGIATLQSLGY